MSDEYTRSTAPYGSHGFLGRDANLCADALLSRYRHNDPDLAARYRAARLTCAPSTLRPRTSDSVPSETAQEHDHGPR